LVNDLCGIYSTRPMVCVDFPLSHKDSCCPSLSRRSRQERRRLGRKQNKDLSLVAANHGHLMSILTEAR
jgi:Fe-S-cluster containining protein